PNIERCGECLRQACREDRIDLEADQAAGAGGQQVRERAAARPDLDGDVARSRGDHVDDAPGDVGVAEEVLPERPRLAARRGAPALDRAAFARRTHCDASRAFKSPSSFLYTSRTWRSVSARLPELSMT